MEPLKIRITGEKKSRTDLDEATIQAADTDTLSLDETYTINATTRGDEVDNRHIVALDESKIIQFTYADDTVWIGNLTNIDEIFPGTATQIGTMCWQKHAPPILSTPYPRRCTLPDSRARISKRSVDSARLMMN